jgi:hypothetical protein
VKVSNFYRTEPTKVRRHDTAIVSVARRLYDGHGVTITGEREDGQRVQVTLSADELANVVETVEGGGK